MMTTFMDNPESDRARRGVGAELECSPGKVVSRTLAAGCHKVHGDNGREPRSPSATSRRTGVLVARDEEPACDAMTSPERRTGHRSRTTDGGGAPRTCLRYFHPALAITEVRPEGRPWSASAPADTMLPSAINDGDGESIAQHRAAVGRHRWTAAERVAAAKAAWCLASSQSRARRLQLGGGLLRHAPCGQGEPAS